VVREKGGSGGPILSLLKGTFKEIVTGPERLLLSETRKGGSNPHLESFHAPEKVSSQEDESHDVARKKNQREEALGKVVQRGP